MNDTYTYEQIKKEYEIVYEKEIDRSRATKGNICFGDIPKKVLVVKIDHVSKFMVLANYHGDEWHFNSGERYVIGELLKEIKPFKFDINTFDTMQNEYEKLKNKFKPKWGIIPKDFKYEDYEENKLNKLQIEYSLAVYKERDKIILGAITEALPDHPEIINAFKSGNINLTIEYFKKHSLIIKMVHELNPAYFSSKTIGCVCKNDIPFYFFDCPECCLF